MSSKPAEVVSLNTQGTVTGCCMRLCNCREVCMIHCPSQTMPSSPSPMSCNMHFYLCTVSMIYEGEVGDIAPTRGKLCKM